MHRLKLHFILGLAVALGASTARAQDASKGLDDQVQNKFDTQDQDSGKTKKQDQAKVKNDDGHRKHWYSMPRFHHKKHDKDAATPQSQANANSKTVAAKPINQPLAAKASANKSAALVDSSKNVKAKPKQTSAMRASQPVHKTVTGRGHATKTASTVRPHKTVAKNSHAKRPVQHNCTSEESKKSGCHASQQQVAKATHTS